MTRLRRVLLVPGVLLALVGIAFVWVGFRLAEIGEGVW